MKIKIFVTTVFILMGLALATVASEQSNKPVRDIKAAQSSADRLNSSFSAPPVIINDTKCYFGSGCLDTSFDFDGILQFLPASGTIRDFGIQAIAVQSDGKIVGAGYNSDSSTGTGMDLMVVRFNSDGNLDTTFGKVDPYNPILRLGYIIDSISAKNDIAKAILVQSDGKIVAAGASNSIWTVVRYNADGTRDATFDGDGLVTANISTLLAYGATIQSDGKIIVVGAPNFTVLRLNPNGSRDGGFGTNGVVSVNPSANIKGSGGAYSVKLQTIAGQERIVVGGYSKDGSTSPNKFSLMRFTSTGAIDTSFGSSGRVSTSFFGRGDLLFSIAIDSTNRIVAGGQAITTSSSNSMDAAVARYMENGALDASFSGDGKTNTDIYGFSDTLRSISIQTDGKILAFGYANTQAGSISSTLDFSLIRYNLDGSGDGTFGPGYLGAGIVTTDINGSDFGYACGLQPDGKIIVAGSSQPGTPPRGTVARYFP